MGYHILLVADAVVGVVGTMEKSRRPGEAGTVVAEEEVVAAAAAAAAAAVEAAEDEEEEEGVV